MKKYYLISIYFVILFVVVFTFVGFAFSFLYPMKFKNKILNSAKEFNLDPALVASVINVESGFKEHAISSAGAMGLMQLMPSTSIEIAQKLGVENFKIKDLLSAETNIRFGCFYLSYLTNLYNGELVNVLAGYNAGFNNVNIWLTKQEYSSDGLVITKTPFKETNDFIKRINNNYNIYAKRF